MTSETSPVSVTSARRPLPGNPAAASGAPPDQPKATSRMAASVIGILIIAGWLTYGPGTGITAGILGASDRLASVAANETTFVLGGLLMLLNSAAVVGIGVMAYPVLKRHSERVAVAYLATRLVEAVLLAVGVISLLSLIAVSEAAGGAQSEALGALAVGANDLAYQIGMATLGLGSVFFCHLLYRTGIVPRGLALWGVVGYAVFAVGMVLDMFGLGVGLALSAPGGAFELALAGWLIAKGFRAPTGGASDGA